ncbi:hypothetical protein SNE40_007750 [Patella caerulea]|uniref:non-specific serine/threonine protein kinase n=1 Tax=Patella caerulea TaxID=87958 RepID=A0AAN8JZN3_PATCE
MERVLIKQGAEGKLYSSEFYGKPCIVKERFTKSYRHPALDKSLTTQRMKAEARALLRCRMSGIECPALYMVDIESRCIIMERVLNSVTVREYTRTLQEKDDAKNLLSLAKQIGEVLGRLHSNNIIHGDLTTSNMLIKGYGENSRIILIDFGLSYFDSVAEDKGVDLYVLERAFLSTHPNTEALFQVILDTYKDNNKTGAEDVMKKLEEIRMRGRKRTMVG